MKKTILVFAFSCFCIVSVSAQEVWSADIQIKSASLTTSPDSYKASFTIFNHWDDAARNVLASFVIPFGAKVLSVSKGCTISPAVAPHDMNGAVYCKLGNMGVGETKIIEIKINKKFHPRRPAYFFHGFVTNESPDPDPANNVKLLRIE